MRQNGRLLGVLVAWAWVAVTLEVAACGISWTVPKDHFDGVNEYGYVSYWEQIGTLDLGEDLRIPLTIGFESNREWVSPHLGKGWILTLLDSRIVQMDDHTFSLVQPDGWTRTFGRGKITDTVLNGQGGWKAEIKGSTITAWADCGWKLVYVQGKLVSISTPKNRTLNLVYSPSGGVSEIRDGASTLLRVVKNLTTGMVSELVYDNQRIGIEQGQRPLVQNINGQNLIGGMASSLNKLTLADGTVKTYEFAVDGKLQPTLKAGDRLMTWDSQNRRILKGGEWSYHIQPDVNPQANAAIGRKNRKGQSEFWHHDGAKGQEIVQGMDGVKKVRSWFASGPSAGKLRKVEEMVNGKSTLVQKSTYDEKGRLIRELKDGVTTTFRYDEFGNQIAAYQSNKTLWQKEYDLQGRLAHEHFEDGAHVVYRHLGLDSLEKTITEANGKKRVELLQGNRVQRRTFSNGTSENYSYYESGALKEKVDSDGIKWLYKYDDKTGKITETCKNGALCWRKAYDLIQKKEIQIYYTPEGKIDSGFDTSNNQSLDSDELEGLAKNKI